MFMTLKYAFNVKGYRSIPATSFPYRMGCQNSDMFRIGLSQAEYSGGVSLAEFQAAFLCSPVFKLELWLLSKTNLVDPMETTNAHLMEVVLGEKSAFGPWTAWAVEGHRTRALSSSSPSTPSSTTPKPPCQIMRCKVNGEPFCDTWWWSVELGDPSPEDDDDDDDANAQRHPQLVFGTALIENGTTSYVIARLLHPFHRIYSRLLLASCKVTLTLECKKRSR